MTRWRCATCMVSMVFVTGAGCPGIEYGEDCGLYLVGADESHVFYEYFEEMADWELIARSSLWSLDLATGESRRVQEPTLQWGLQAQGDYYITMQQSDVEDMGQIVAVQISTGKSVTINERLRYYWPYYSAPILDETRVLILAESGLMLYDLVTEAVTKTIEVPEDTNQLIDFKGNQAVIRCSYKSVILVDLETGGLTDIPSPPSDLSPAYSNILISDTWLVTNDYEFGDLISPVPHQSIILFHIPTQSWSKLAEYDNMGGLFYAAVVYPTGIDDQHVVAYRYDMMQFGSQYIELLDIQTGDRQVIYEGESYYTLSPIMCENQVYSVDTSTCSLAVYDIAAGTRSTLPLATTESSESYE